MLYHAYERQADLLQMVQAAAQSALTALTPWDKLTGRPLRYATAANALLARAGLSHQRPAYRIGAVMVGNRDVPVTEEAVFATPFGTLLHFKKDIATPQPRMLVVAPLSGHFATLLRNSVAKWPESGATTSMRGCGVAMSFLKCRSVPNGVAKTASSVTGTSRFPTITAPIL